MLRVHKFQSGESIKAFENKPEYGRLIVSSTTEEFTNGWFNKTTRVAFIKGKMADLQARFGNLAAGAVVTDNMTIIKKESTTPFYQKADGSNQDPKINPTTGEVIMHNGAPVYMQFEIAPKGTADVLVGQTETVEQVAERNDYA